MRRRLQILFGIVAASALLGDVARAASPPSVITGGTSGVVQSSAVLHGTVNPNGASTTYFFQWGTTSAYGSSGTVYSAGSGTKALAVLDSAVNLTPATTYHYRLVASNRLGPSYGADRTFTTAGVPPPQVITGPVTQVSTTGASLTGTINPSGQVTTWYFQWGSLQSRSQQTRPQTLSASSAPQNVASSLAGLLRPGKIYQYRLVATHPGSVASYGSIATFMTYPSPRPYAAVRAIARPRHARRKPYTLRTSGSIRRPSWIPSQYACAGDVVIRFYRGHHRVRKTVAPVQPNCTFSAVTVFHKLPRGRRKHRPLRLLVMVRFLSNAYLAPSSYWIGHVTLG